MRSFVLLLVSFFASDSSAQSSEAFLEQVGTLNVASIAQFAAQNDAYASLKQVGEANQAWIEQTNGSTAYIEQRGNGNLLAGLDALRGLDGSLATALQFDSSHLVLSQFGTDNRVFLEQAAGSHAEITQRGSNNTVTLIQGGIQ